MYNQNVRGMRTKLKKFSLTILTSYFDVVLLTDTWLSSDFQDLELGFKGYTVYSKNRDC